MPYPCRLFGAVVLFTVMQAAGQTASVITTPKEALGFNLGDDYHVANYSQLNAYWHKLAIESDRMKLVDIGPTAENRRQYMAIISSPANIKNLEHYQQISQKLAHAEGLSDDEARALAHEGKAIVWIDGGLHASETVGSQQEMEEVYQMVSRNDAETLRFLDDTILLCVLANPDGQELVANWYMREPDPAKRSLNNLPVLFQHYIGHDNNRDFYMSNMPETTNMNRQLFMEWFPQIVYNHHQTGPAGAVIFMPPFRDPFNYTFDPLIPLDVEAVGTAMHQRLVADGKGGSAQRSGASYSTWWNGGLRTICYFHNMIGLLTEIIGNPTPMQIPLVADKQLPSGDWPLPIAPQTWHYRQSIEYEMSNNRAVLDYASRNRETLLYDAYVMGKHSIENGMRDHWTVTPRRIEALKAAAGTPAAANAENEFRAATIKSDLYQSVLRDPKFRDARGYILSADQPDFATATKFANALLKTGITVLKASEAFIVNGKNYPAGSLIVKAAQAFRPHILDMFEPQDHPNDFQYPGGPPIPPYDSAGWTLAFQMGVQFDRILDGFDGPFVKVDGLFNAPAAQVTGVVKPVGYLLDHRQNDSFVVVNRLLKLGCSVYWLAKPVDKTGSGAIWVPANALVRQILEKAAKQLGVGAEAMSKAPGGEALQLKRIRIGLFDEYGGLMTSGWNRWLLEQFEFPFEVVYPQALDAGNLRERFDVLVFSDGAFRRGGAERGRQPKAEEIPEQYRSHLGRLTEETSMPQLQKFVAAGGTVIDIGSSGSMASLLGVPLANHLTEMGKDGTRHALSREKFYVPGSLLKVHIDNSNPLAYGMPQEADVFFENSPVFDLLPEAAMKQTQAVAWFDSATPLDSGWAWGQQYLKDGIAVAEAEVGEGRVIVLGPEVTFRGQPHGTFKLFFNGLYYGSAKKVTLP